MPETVRKTFKEKLRPTPRQERQLELVLWRCRTLYNTALEQRITAWQRCHVSVSRYEQEAELKAIRAEMQSPEVVSDALRLHACYEKLQAAEANVAALYARWADLEAKQ